MLADARLVFQFDEGQMAFRHIRPSASYQQLFKLANAINSIQSDAARQILVVTTREFGGAGA